MDHQWNYATGLPDPRYPGGGRGLNASNDASIWVNLDGKRFVNELESVKAQFPAVLRQRESRYWAIFDEKSKRRMFVSGSDWADFETVEHTLLENRELVKKADSIEEIARQAQLPVAALVDTMTRYNRMARARCDRHSAVLRASVLSSIAEEHGRSAHRSRDTGTGRKRKGDTGSPRGR
jgi:hypothetical protein